MEPLRIVIVGPGRAGGSVALAASAAGHEIVGVIPGPSGRIPDRLELVRVDGTPPRADLLVIAPRDDAIGEVVGRLADDATRFDHACHLSGLASVELLAPLRAGGCSIGSFHPVQSLPDEERGSRALAGAHAAVSGDAGTVELLASFAESLGMSWFMVADHLKPLHHAAASAASNFVVASLAVAAELVQRAGIPRDAYRPLTLASVDNAYDADPLRVLTGPVARGDVGTVTAQLEAAESVSPQIGRAFTAMVQATAALTPHEEALLHVVASRR